MYTESVTSRQREVMAVNRFSPKRLRGVMEEAALSQAELARRMGVSRASLSRILRGLRCPSSKFIGALKTAFPDKPMECFFEISSAPRGHPGSELH
jgi:DNA-binding XRE family transcriptional regulator